MISRIRENKFNLISHLCASLFLITTFLIFGPIELYISNIDILWFSISNVVLVSLMAGISVLVVLMLIWFIVPASIKVYTTCLIWGLAFAFYVQGNFMHINYGLLDGSTVDWSKYGVWSLINILIWICLIIIPFGLYKFKNKIWNKFIPYTSVLLVLMQVVTLIYLFLTSNLTKSEYYLSTNKMFELGSNKNIVVLLLDTYDTILLNQILEEEPELLNTDFDGFTYYRNAMGKYPNTDTAIPLLLTGSEYKSQERYSEYLSKAYVQSDFYPVLDDNNYSYGFYTTERIVGGNFKEKLDNSVKSDIKISSYNQFSTLLYKFTAVKYMPHCLKKQFWMYSGDFDQLKSSDSEAPYVLYDPDFYNDLLNDKVQTGDVENRFIFYHLNGTHAPFYYDEFVKHDDNSDGYKQAKGGLRIVKEFLQQLKEASLYDNTMFIVMADHGYQVVHLGNSPMLLVKDFNNNDPFAISDSPVAFEDIMITVLNSVDPTNDYGKNLWDWNADDKRDRTYYYYHLRETAPDGHLPDIVEYVFKDSDKLVGYVTGTVYTQGSVLEKPVSVYRLGDNLLVRDQSIYDYITYGLAPYNDEDDVWTIEHTLIGNFDLQSVPQNDLEFTIKYRHIYQDYQRLILYANEQYVGEYQFTGNEISIVIPASMLDSALLSLRMELPDAVTPFHLDESFDVRTLGVIVQEMVISEISL